MNDSQWRPGAARRRLRAARRWVERVGEPALTASVRTRALFARGRVIQRYLQAHAVRKLQIGCGKNLLPGWLNTDLTPQGKGVIYLNAKRPLPFPGDSFDYIFSEHMIEHIEHADAAHLLRECQRVLRPGGTLRVATPDLRFLLEICRGEQTEAQRRYIRWVSAAWLPESGDVSAVHVVNNFFYNFGHRFIYDEPTLARLLLECGFGDVVRRQPGESAHEALRGIERHHEHIGVEFNQLETMVVEARKPARPEV